MAVDRNRSRKKPYSFCDLSSGGWIMTGHLRVRMGMNIMIYFSMECRDLQRFPLSLLRASGRAFPC